MTSKGGKHGDLRIKVKVEPGTRWRKGDDVYSEHFLTLAEAFNRCHIEVPTLDTSVKVKVDPYCPRQQYELEGKGVKGARHVALVKIRMPRGVLDDEISDVMDNLGKEWTFDHKSLLESGSRV